MNVIWRKKSMDIKFAQSEGFIIFCAAFQKHKMSTIPHLLALKISYKYRFMKKMGGCKFCTMFRFNQFLVHHFENAKMWRSKSLCKVEVRSIFYALSQIRKMLAKKNMTIIKFTQSRVLIGYWCFALKT